MCYSGHSDSVHVAKVKCVIVSVLSIIKMDLDLDCDSGSMDGETASMEEGHIHIKEETIHVKGSGAEVISDFDRKPFVYTTRLDDMTILSSDTSILYPEEVTAEILKESKPTLQTLANINNSRRIKRTFKSLKAKLKKIYYPDDMNIETELDIKLESLPSEMDENFEEFEDSMGASECTDIGTNPIKCEVLEEPSDVCKYSELLKLCRPFSIVLSTLYGYDVIQKDTAAPMKKLLKPVNSKTKIVKPVKKTKVLKDVQPNNATSSDDEPLITLNPSLRPNLENNDEEVWYGVKTKTGQVNVRKPAIRTGPQSNLQRPTNTSFYNFGGNRVLTNGLMEVEDLYSNEFNIYCTDHKGCLIDYYKDTVDNAHKYLGMHASASSSYMTIKSCCWVQRDATIQSMYPKILLYTNLRFMRKLHTCPPGACVCCCRKEEIFETPDIVLIDDAYAEIPPPYLKEDIEIQALDKEIQSSIIKMNKTPRVNTTDILRNLLNNPSNKEPVGDQGSISLIDKALTYKKPLPKKQNYNRRLLTLKQQKSEVGVIVLRNFAADEREIFEFNSDGGLKSFLKLTCFSNTDPPDVKKLLQKSKSVNDVCCWFKREKLITKLVDSKTLHPSAAKFIRTYHTCKGDECSCCCKPNVAKDVTLTDITLPSRPTYWPELLRKMKKLVKPETCSDNSSGFIPRSSKAIPAAPKYHTTTTVPKVTKSLPRKTPKIAQVDVLGTAAPLLDKQYLKPSVPFNATSSKTTIDDDCQFVRIAPAPKVVDPLNPVSIEQDKNITNVSGADLSSEVNTLITSILDRFKDVRLTINSDGKVAAALNTPVNTLSTVELKVLANILSYAQTQVNSLGLNSGMSLSNVINLKVNDTQLTTSIDPASIYQAFGSNVNMNNNPQAVNVNNTFVNTTLPNIAPTHTTFPELSSAPTKHEINNYFTKSMYSKNEGHTRSFTSLLSAKFTAQDSIDTNVPVIQNVYSLKDQETKAENESSTTTVWCRKPANQKSRVSKADNNTQKSNENTKKRAPGMETTPATPPVTKRIRVLSPSKLVVPSVAQPIETVNAIYRPAPNSQTPIQINTLTPVVPLLMNNNFRVVSVMNPQIQQLGTRPRIIREHNFKTFSPPVSSAPSILVSPLNVKNFNGNVAENEVLPLVGNPVSVASIATSTEVLDTIKIEEVYNEDDDCILGV